MRVSFELSSFVEKSLQIVSFLSVSNARLTDLASISVVKWYFPWQTIGNQNFRTWQVCGTKFVAVVGTRLPEPMHLVV